MLKVAICDDEQVYLERTCAMLEQYAAEQDVEITAETFVNSSALLDSIEAGARCDIYLLDIYMPGVSGMSVATELRSRGVRSPIIFLTSFTEHAVEAFGVDAPTICSCLIPSQTSLPPDTPTLNFFLTLTVHLILFFVTTTGSVQKKGFLFFSCASIYTCFSTMYTIVNTRLQNGLLKGVLALGLMALMQVLLYAVLLPFCWKSSLIYHLPKCENCCVQLQMDRI